MIAVLVRIVEGIIVDYCWVAKSGCMAWWDIGRYFAGVGCL